MLGELHGLLSLHHARDTLYSATTGGFGHEPITLPVVCRVWYVSGHAVAANLVHARAIPPGGCAAPALLSPSAARGSGECQSRRHTMSTSSHM